MGSVAIMIERRSQTGKWSYCLGKTGQCLSSSPLVSLVARVQFFFLIHSQCGRWPKKLQYLNSTWISTNHFFISIPSFLSITLTRSLCVSRTGCVKYRHFVQPMGGLNVIIHHCGTAFLGNVVTDRVTNGGRGKHSCSAPELSLFWFCFQMIFDWFFSGVSKQWPLFSMP